MRCGMQRALWHAGCTEGEQHRSLLPPPTWPAAGRVGQVVQGALSPAVVDASHQEARHAASSNQRRRGLRYAPGVAAEGEGILEQILPVVQQQQGELIFESLLSPIACGGCRVWGVWLCRAGRQPVVGVRTSATVHRLLARLPPGKRSGGDVNSSLQLTHLAASTPAPCGRPRAAPHPERRPLPPTAPPTPSGPLAGRRPAAALRLRQGRAGGGRRGLLPIWRPGCSGRAPAAPSTAAAAGLLLGWGCAGRSGSKAGKACCRPACRTGNGV